MGRESSIDLYIIFCIKKILHVHSFIDFVPFIDDCKREAIGRDIAGGRPEGHLQVTH